MADSQPETTDDVTDSVTSNPLSSCLRNKNKSNRQQLKNRSVSFPDDDSRIVTGYFEPVNPWVFAESTSKETILANYIKSCEKHGTHPIRKVIEQLEELPYGDGGERYDCLNLKGEPLVLGSCEALEEVLKRVQFEKLNLEDTGLDDEASVALFDMIEYYEAATHLNISCNPNVNQRGWQACSRMLKRTKCLDQLECRNTPLNETLIQFLSRALRIGTQLQVLKLENCSLGGRPIVILAAALKLNTSLKELYLADNDLTSNDATHLSALLKCNGTLQLLDISNNCIADIGFGHICDALCEQSHPAGLNILVLWNNRLKTPSANHLNRVLRLNNTLEMLNIGHNELKDNFLYEIKDALTKNKNLLRIGMQSTQLTIDGAVTLAHVIQHNPVLQRIDLRDNDLQIEGLLALSVALQHNSSITQLDLDDYPKSRLQVGETMERYISLVEEMRGYCSRNEAGGDEAVLRAKLNNSSIVTRKISLTCDTSTFNRYRSPAPSSPIATSSLLQVDPTARKGTGGRLRSPAPSPIPSPVASPSPTRTRFQVSKVSEDSPPSENNIFFGNGNQNHGGTSGMRSRFRVTTVSDTDDESSPPVITVRSSPPVVQQQEQQQPIPQPQPALQAQSLPQAETPPQSQPVPQSEPFPQSQPSPEPEPKPEEIVQPEPPLEPVEEDPPVPIENPVATAVVTVAEPPPPPPVLEEKKAEIPSRTRKLSSWMNPIFSTERGAAASGLEKLLGMFQNPFGTGQDGTEVGSSLEISTRDNAVSSGELFRIDVGTSGGATWPQAIVRPVISSSIQASHSTSAPSLTALAVIPPTG